MMKIQTPAIEVGLFSAVSCAPWGALTFLNLGSVLSRSRRAEVGPHALDLATFSEHYAKEAP